MTVTIRCACGASYVVDTDDESITQGPGDITTEAHTAAATEHYLGFTTPALGEER